MSKARQWLAAMAAAACVATGVVFVPTVASAAPCPWGTQCISVNNTKPANGATLSGTVELEATARQLQPERGDIVKVEWWLYHPSFVEQNPNNGEGKILLFEQEGPPASGTRRDGRWTGSWTVTNQMTTRDGDYNNPGMRTYNLPDDGRQYKIEAHVLDEEWVRTWGGPPGRSSAINVNINFGGGGGGNPPPPPPPPPGGCNGYSAEYFNDMGLSNPPATTRCDAQIDFTWPGTTGPSPAVDGSTFSARWTRTVNFEGGDYKFDATADDGIRVRLDGTLILNEWKDQPPSDYSVTRAVSAGNHTIVVEYYEKWGGARAKFSFAKLGSNPPPPPPPVPGPNLIGNPNLATGSPLPTCYMDGSWGTHSRSGALVSDVPANETGRSYRMTVTNYQSGDAKLMPSEGSGCAATVDPSKQYSLGISYKSTNPINSIPLFTYTPGTGWQYWTTLRTLPATSTWTRITGAVPQIPAGASRISFGLAAQGNGVSHVTGFSITEGTTQNPPPVDPPPGGGGSAATGEWSTSQVNMPLRAIHSTLLQDGRVLLIAGSGNDPNSFQAGSFKTTVWNPSTNVFTDVPTPMDMFCAGHVTLPDGKVLISGGTLSYPGVNGEVSYRGAKDSYVFNPATNSFSQLNDTIEGHWYPTLTKLENGDVWSAGGYSDQSGPARSTEMFDFSANRWLSAGEVPQTNEYWGTYPHMFLMGDNRLFYTGGHTFGDGRPGSGATIYNWRTRAMADVPGLRDKNLRDQAGSVLLPPAQNQVFMIAGGGSTDRGGNTNKVDLIDLKQATPAYVPGPDLPGPGRMYLNLTTLPNRTVLASNGGQSNRSGNVSAAAIYNPATNAWTSVDADPVGRNYHSSSLLLTDGRVAVFGSNPLDNSFELRISIYAPPYMFKGTRPTITSAVSNATYGQSFDVGVTGNPTSASLVSPGSATHQTDTNARLVDLAMTGSGSTRRVTIPSNPALLPAGPYMLTVLDDQGVPSTARWVNVQ